MPIVKSTTVNHVFSELHVDMGAMKAIVVFRKIVEGVDVGYTNMVVEGQALADFLAAIPPANKPRGADVADTAYQVALDTGLLTGSIA